MTYGQFRHLAIKYPISSARFFEAVRQRKDPELLKTFHERFTEYNVSRESSLNFPRKLPIYWYYLVAQREAELAEKLAREKVWNSNVPEEELKKAQSRAIDARSKLADLLLQYFAEKAYYDDRRAIELFYAMLVEPSER